MAFDPTCPFVLLDDARPGGIARLFTGIAGVVETAGFDDVRPALARLRHAGTVAGFIGFEAGFALEPRLRPLARDPRDGLPLLWFGQFADVTTLDEGALAGLLGDRHAAIGAVDPALDATDYAAAVGAVQALIAAGDIYQANLTFTAQVATFGHPLALYRALRAGQAAPYGALIHTGSAWVLSFSPELFFELRGRALTTRPMKGTAARGPTRADDDAAAAALAADPKNRAENLMIVDLLRNDLSRVAEPGSVAVPALFDVERYPTLLQMTSTVTAAARPHIDAVDVIEAIFPCGSITGAPKLRAMEVIAAVEPQPRGLYTGSIGSIDANGDAAFNVAIRTLVVTAPGSARLGLGAGIVADSDPAAEWHECLAKSAFLQRRRTPDLIETMRLDDGRIALLDHHLDRLRASAARLGHRLDAAAVRAALTSECGTARLRLLLSPTGTFALHRSPLPVPPDGPVTIAAVPLTVEASDWRLRHKTTDRGFYDDARRTSGAFEMVFVLPDGHVTEGSFTSIFVPRGGVLLTPPAAAGLLSGVLRAALLASGDAVEAPIAVADLGSGFFIGNALRGLLPARLRG